jgi:cell division septation protein DedD
MGSIYLNNNESIILSTHNVVINTIPAEAILTNQRLILVDSRHSQLRPQDIPFTALETVTIGDTSEMDPILSLSLLMKDGTRHTLGIVFPRVPKTKRMGERDEWAVKLKEASVNAQQEHGVLPAELAPPWIPGDIPEEAGEPGKGQESPDEKFRNPPLAPRKHRAGSPSGNRTAIAGLVIILIIAGAIGVYFFAPSFIGKRSTPTTPVATPAVTTTATQVPQTPAQPTAAITQQPYTTPGITAAETTAPQSLIPGNGVWVQIDYAGNFTASFGTAGRMRDVTGSGSQFYQVPAKDEIVDATVQKLDDSGNVLTVSFYNDGQLAKSSTTSHPHGTIDIHVDLRTAAAARQTATG